MEKIENMPFDNEAAFEEALIGLLCRKYGWANGVLQNCTEEDLVKNWAEILFNNNRGRDRLNDYPLTAGEMQQILEQITALKTPLKLNGFINGKYVTVKRDNPDDKEHCGREVSLKIYDRGEIAAGGSVYQIVRQPKFSAKSKILNDRRGDLMLLINGMPVIHIELKKSGIPVSQAYHQIEKYAREKIFTGLFSLVQIFVAMTPEETRYFANPGPDGVFNEDFYFRWADFNNEPFGKWQKIAENLLSIPMAHQLIGFYTVADASDGILKVMRSYQYYAANAISDKVTKHHWEAGNQPGGHIVHTTGSGKTMTSFKSAQLIASSGGADKVLFLMDRIELGTQSLKEYRAFANDDEEVQATENTGALAAKLTSDKPDDTLIVTSIQKMSNIKDEAEGGLKADDIAKMNGKRIVFIVDECHRSTFGEMLAAIKKTFPRAIFFGFTGTPIYDENQKKMSTTATLFGDELHRYSIADGIRDKNVLGFDPDKVLTFKDEDVRRAVALGKAKAKTAEEALADARKSRVFYYYMGLPMPRHLTGRTDKKKFGIEKYLPVSQYESEEHRQKVAEDIAANWLILSRNSKFHALLAASSIPEAIAYYRLLKQTAPQLKITALFDPNIDNNGGSKFKEDGLVEIIDDYNQRYGHDFSLATYPKMKKDIGARLSHKKPYERLERTPEKQLDLLIVVDQMLTGFDSKWLNTLYLDKELKYEHLIQAFSRTNRLFAADEKPFGKIKYYRYPHTMEQNIAAAVKLYSGEKEFSLFAEKLDKNLVNMNACYAQIKELFAAAGIENFSKLPKETAEKKRFAGLFRTFNEFLAAAKIQGFAWEKKDYSFAGAENEQKRVISAGFTETEYKILALRYKELFREIGGGGGGAPADPPYDLAGYLTTIDTAAIDADYMNSRFAKFKKVLASADAAAIKQAEEELHKTFAALTQEEQKFANVFLHDIQCGKVKPEEGKTLRDYITEYQTRAKDDQIHRCAQCFGLDEEKLRELMASGVAEANINEFGRYDALTATADMEKAKAYFEAAEGKTIIPPKVYPKLNILLRAFILQGGFGLDGNKK